MPNTIYVREIPEERIPSKPLGRHVRHDSRSLLYPFMAGRERTAIAAQSWPRSILVLDQGDLGSCTGNALTGALGTAPNFQLLPAGHPALDENEAIALYSAATKLDSYRGTYPPTDTGSDGLSVCKAGVQAALMSGYTHTFSLDDMEQALQVGPVIVGVDWYSSFDSPDSNGLVSISKGAYVRGGHEFEVAGIDPVKQEFQAWQSWGPDWGVAGKFYFSYATMSQLLASQGDVTVPVPLAAPAPTPIPVPPSPDDSLLSELVALVKQDWTAVQTWLSDHGL